MVDAQARVQVPAAARQQHPVGQQLRTVTFQAHVEFMPGQGSAQFQVDASVAGLARQHRVGAQQAGATLAVGLHPGMVQLRATGQVYVGEAVSQVGMGAVSEVVFDHGQRRAFAQLQQVAQMPGAVPGVDRTDEH